MNRILVSACLMGEPVRYDGRPKTLDHPLVDLWRAEGRLVVFCPEMAAGFQVPRLAAEIAGGHGGEAVLAGSATVIDRSGADLGAAFVAGAERALERARETGCVAALLIDGSPSCGSGFIYDGSFSGRRHNCAGVTAALLRQNGIAVFRPDEIDALAAFVETRSSVQP